MGRIFSESIFYEGLLTLVPAALLASRFFRRKPSWWVILPSIVIVGWAVYFMAVVDHFEKLYDLVENTENPSQELLEEAYTDGGSLTFAALFGWLVALFYAGPWFILFLVATSLRGVARRFRKEKG